jgi:hypothetical protein
MQKDFMTITPDSGGGSQEVTVAVPANTGNARSSTITIQGGGITRTIDVNQEATKVLELPVYFELENNCPDYIPNGGNEVDVVRLRLSEDLQAENSTISTTPGSSDTYEEYINNVDSSASYQAMVIFNSSQGASAGLTIIGEVTDNEGTVLLPSQSLTYSDSGAQRDFNSNYFTFKANLDSEPFITVKLIFEG